MGNPVQSAIIETKVIVATATSAVVGVVVALLNTLSADPSTLLGLTPNWLEFVIVAAVPPAATYLAGYLAPHTERPDIHPRTQNPLSPRN